MKTYLHMLGVMALTFAFAPALANAAGLTLTPATITVTQGSAFTVTVAVDAGDAKMTAAKVQVSYPEGLLDAVSFTPAASWVTLSQPGFDQIGQGTVTKTAGFPKGFFGSKTFGTITFRAMQAGSATITTTSGSLVYNEAGQNALTSGDSTQVTVVVVPPTTPGVSTPTAPSGVQEPGAITPATSTAAESTTTNAGQAAAVAAAGGLLSSVPTWFWMLIIAFLLAGSSYIAYRTYKKNQSPEVK